MKICSMKEIAIAFHLWMRENDTQENAERWCGFSEEDMFDEFAKLKTEKDCPYNFTSRCNYDTCNCKIKLK